MPLSAGRSNTDLWTHTVRLWLAPSTKKVVMDTPNLEGLVRLEQWSGTVDPRRLMSGILEAVQELANAHKIWSWRLQTCHIWSVHDNIICAFASFCTASKMSLSSRLGSTVSLHCSNLKLASTIAFFCSTRQSTLRCITMSSTFTAWLALGRLVAITQSPLHAIQEGTQS